MCAAVSGWSPHVADSEIADLSDAGEGLLWEREHALLGFDACVALLAGWASLIDVHATINYAICLKNRAPTRALPDKTPFKVFWGRKPDVLHLHPFGAPCWVLRQDTTLNKLTHKSHLCRFLGFSEESCAYHLYNPKTRQIITLRNIIFDKTGVHFKGEIPTIPPVVEGEQGSSEQQPPEDARPSLLDPTTPSKPSYTPATPAAPSKRSPSQIPVYTRTLHNRAAPIDYHKKNNPDACKPAPRFQPPAPHTTPTNAPATVKFAVDDQDFVFITNTNNDPQSLAEA
ncbi:hypothetical protein VTO73DRAFT_6017 [Trametes versicolor]